MSSAMKRRLAVLAATGTALAGCSAVRGAETDAVDYWLWDANQLPAYQACAEAFEAQSGVEIRISQYGWDDYWQKLTAALVAGSGPDVFTDHVARYPEYVSRGALLDLNTQEATRGIGPEEFHDGLADMWVGPDGGTYGIPKDFDAIALFYDRNVIEEAGLSEEDLQDLEWNPEDGGTYEEVIARLTVDANGVRGDEEGFDPDAVVQYGLGTGGAGEYRGQTEWSQYAYATGWHHTDEELWATEYRFDAPEIQDTLGWYFGLVDKGFLPSYQTSGGSPNTQQLGAGQVALIADGSWMVGTYAALEGIDLGIATLPAGPVGHPVSMFNGLGDSINAETDVPELAAEWVAFLGSDECQIIVGEHAVVLPARPAGTDAAVEAFAERGIDMSAFTELVEEGHTALHPLTEYGPQIESIMGPVMESIYLGQQDVSALTDANERINALFED